MLWLKAWHAIRASCFNSRSPSSNWAIGMFRQSKNTPTITRHPSLIADASFPSFPSARSYRINRMARGHPVPSRKWGLGSKDRWRALIGAEDPQARCRGFMQLQCCGAQQLHAFQTSRAHPAMRSVLEGNFLNPHLSWHLRLNT